MYKKINLVKSISVNIIIKNSNKDLGRLDMRIFDILEKKLEVNNKYKTLYFSEKQIQKAKIMRKIFKIFWYLIIKAKTLF